MYCNVSVYVLFSNTNVTETYWLSYQIIIKLLIHTNKIQGDEFTYVPNSASFAV